MRIGSPRARGLNAWDVDITKSADQTVTNNATLQKDSQLSFDVDAGETWYVQLLLFFSGSNATRRLQVRLELPLASGFVRYVGDNTTADAINVSTGVRFAAATNVTSIALGTDATDTPRVFELELCCGRPRTARFSSASRTTPPRPTGPRRRARARRSWRASSADEALADARQERPPATGTTSAKESAAPRHRPDAYRQLAALATGVLTIAALIAWLLVRERGADRAVVSPVQPTLVKQADLRRVAAAAGTRSTGRGRAPATRTS